MKFAEIEKVTKNIRRTVGKKYGYRQSDYINWKIKDGYFFCLDTLHVVCTELRVKPLFLDDLYWPIISPKGDNKLPDSLRGNGALSSLCELIWKEFFPKDLKNDFTPERYEQLIEDAYKSAEEKINIFLHKYPRPEMFEQFLIDIHDENSDKLLTNVLIAINKGDFKLAVELASQWTVKARGKNYYTIRDQNGNLIQKCEYEFILDYCHEKESLSD